VPGDPAQVVYVWFDALANYISALRAPNGDDYQTWWHGARDRVHVIGKGILRFHAVYWPAILRSAGQPWPTTIFVHDYLTAGGTKIGKSLGNTIDPVEVSDQYGIDALRWWLLREVPRTSDADFTVERLTATANRDLANGIGNFAKRTHGLVARADTTIGDGRTLVEADPLLRAIGAAPRAIDDALDAFDFRRALGALLAVVNEGNRYIDATRPWEPVTIGRGPASGSVLRPLVDAVSVLGRELEPFVPQLASRVRTTSAEPVFRRLELSELA
jgi:methionyl-tRNA synthetase